MIRIENCTHLDLTKYNAIIDKLDVENEEYTIAHNPILPKLLSDIFGYKPVYYSIKSDDADIGYIIGCEINGRFVSIPHFSYGGPILDSMLDIGSIINEQINNFEIRGFDKISDNYTEDKITSYLILEKSVDEQLKSFKYNVRRQIKIAKANLVLKVGKANLLDDFFNIYAENMKRLGSPPQPKIFFEKLLKSYDFGESLLFCVYHENVCVGASFYLSYEDVAEVCWSATKWQFNKLFPSYLLHWELIAYAIKNNVKVFYFGRSSEGSGALSFKRHWKPIEKPIYFNLSGADSFFINKSFLKKALSRYWSKFIPVKLGVLIGEKFSKHLY